MSKGKVTPPEVVEKIKVCVASGLSYLETARLNGVADSTVHTIMKRVFADEKEAKEFEKLKEQKKREMQSQAEKDFDKQMKASFEKLFTKSMKVIEKGFEDNIVTPKDAMVILGTSFDKRQVLVGGKTANVGISFEDVLKEINKGNEY